MKFYRNFADILENVENFQIFWIFLIFLSKIPDLKFCKNSDRTLIGIVRLVRSLADRTFQLRREQQTEASRIDALAAKLDIEADKVVGAQVQDTAKQVWAQHKRQNLYLAWILSRLKSCTFLAGSFSAVSKWNFARKYAFDSIFQALQDLHTFAPLQSQNFSKKIGLKNQQFSWKFRKHFANVAKSENFAKFQNVQLDNLADFGRCCKTRIFLQRSAPIQPKTN